MLTKTHKTLSEFQKLLFSMVRETPWVSLTDPSLPLPQSYHFIYSLRRGFFPPVEERENKENGWGVYKWSKPVVYYE